MVQRSLRSSDPAVAMRDLGFGPLLLIASFPVKMSGEGGGGGRHPCDTGKEKFVRGGKGGKGRSWWVGAAYGGGQGRAARAARTGLHSALTSGLLRCAAAARPCAGSGRGFQAYIFSKISPRSEQYFAAAGAVGAAEAARGPAPAAAPVPPVAAAAAAGEACALGPSQAAAEEAEAAVRTPRGSCGGEAGGSPSGRSRKPGARGELLAVAFDGGERALGSSAPRACLLPGVVWRLRGSDGGHFPVPARAEGPAAGASSPPKKACADRAAEAAEPPASRAGARAPAAGASAVTGISRRLAAAGTDAAAGGAPQASGRIGRRTAHDGAPVGAAAASSGVEAPAGARGGARGQLRLTAMGGFGRQIKEVRPG